MKKNYAMFVACTDGGNGTNNYLPYLNALINSIYVRNLYQKRNLTVFVLHSFWSNDKYLDDITGKLPFNVVSVPVEPKEVKVKHPKEFIKRARYSKIRELGKLFNVSCLLDVDMFFVSDAFMNLFDMVNGTNLCIGCNERYKWGTSRYYYKGRKMFDKDIKLYQMICNTPAIFDMNKWDSVFDRYCDFIEHARCIEGNGEKKLGDLYLWNTAIKYQGRENDVVAFPMDTMAQVHKTDMRDFTYPIVENGYWRSFNGDRRYIQHGRIAQASFVENSVSWFLEVYKGWKDIEKVKAEITKGLKEIQKEWYDLNFNSTLILSDYMKIPEFYHNFKG